MTGADASAFEHCSMRFVLQWIGAKKRGPVAGPAGPGSMVALRRDEGAASAPSVPAAP